MGGLQRELLKKKISDPRRQIQTLDFELRAPRAALDSGLQDFDVCRLKSVFWKCAKP